MMRHFVSWFIFGFAVGIICVASQDDDKTTTPATPDSEATLSNENKQSNAGNQSKQDSPTLNATFDELLELALYNLTTKNFSVVTIEEEPWVKFDRSSNLSATGYIPDLIAELQDRIGFKYYWKEAQKFGQIQKDKTWNGMIGEVISNMDTIAAAPLTMTSARAKEVKFLTPFKNTGLQLVMLKSYINKDKDQHPIVEAFNILSPMTPTVWSLSIFAMFVVGLLLYVNNLFNPYEWKRRHELGRATASEGELFNLKGSLWFTFSTFTWQGYERAPRSVAAKLLAFIWFGFVLLFILTYIGSLYTKLFLTSTLHGVDMTTPPARDLDHVLKDKDIVIGCVEGGSTHSYIEHSIQNDLQEVNKRWKQAIQSNDTEKNPFVNSTKEGIDRVARGNYAFITESLTAEFYVHNYIGCNITTVGPVFAKRSYGFAVSSHLTDAEITVLNMEILNMAESGDSDELEHKWWRVHGHCWDKQQVEQASAKMQNHLMKSDVRRVDMAMFWAPIVILAVGVGTSFITGVAETLHYKYRGRYQQNNLPSGAQLRLDNEEVAG